MSSIVEAMLIAGLTAPWSTRGAGAYGSPGVGLKYPAAIRASSRDGAATVPAIPRGPRMRRSMYRAQGSPLVAAITSPSKAYPTLEYFHAVPDEYVALK